MENKTTFIDLGLPSGTLWAEHNEEGFYAFDEAVSKYGNSLPTREQLIELKSQCKWEWVGNGYKVTGLNGNYIVLPAEGYRSCNGFVHFVGFGGDYWSSTPKGSDDAWCLSFYSGGVRMNDNSRCYGFSVRLVKKKDNNMKNKEINIAEILKDCPKGMRLYATTVGECTLESITNDGRGYPIMVRSDIGSYTFTAYGKITDIATAECLLFPSKDNRDWSTFNVRQNFKKGNFVARVHDGKSTILLMGDTDWSSPSNEVKYICLLNLSNDRFHVSEFIIDYWCTIKDFYEQDGYRLATDEEKKQLLDAIDKHGYVWDSEKLELRKKEHEFKPFDRVLVRDLDNERWMTGLFSHTVNDSAYGYKYAVNGVYWKMCIPYEGNEHLLGTCDSPDEKGGKE